MANHALGHDADEHYRLAVDLARQTESPGGAAARASLYAGIYFHQRGQTADAQRHWRDALRTIDRAVAGDSADNPGVLLYRAMFELLVRGRPASQGVPEVTPGDGFVPYQLASLAATYAYLGEVDLAAAVLSDTLRLGSSYPGWKTYVGVAAPAALESPEFLVFSRDYEERLDALRELR